MMQLLNLDIFRWQLWPLFLIPALINFGIFIYAKLHFKRDRLTLLFTKFVLSQAALQLTEGLVRMSQTLEVAYKWNKPGEIAILFVILYGIRFFTQLTNRKSFINTEYFSYGLYIPTAFFIVLILTNSIQFSIVPSPVWYWVANPVKSTVSNLFFLWNSLGGLAMFGLLINYYFKSKTNFRRKRQAIILLLGISLPVFLGVTTEVIFPLFLHLDDIPLTSAFATSLSVFSLIAIKKYNLFDYSPKHQWENIVEHMNEGILIVDNDDKIMYANKTFCEMLGYDFEELKGRVAMNLLLDEKDRQIVQNAIKHHKKFGNSKFEIRFKTKTGNTIWVEVNTAPYFDSHGKIIGSVGLQTDITARKLNEEAVKHTELRLKQAQNVAKVGNWELNFSTGKALWSDEACRIYGISENEKDKQSFESWFAAIHPEDKEAVMAETERAKGTLSDSSFKHRIIKSDGTIRHIYSVAQFEFNASGFPIGLFGICHDITDQVESERSLNESERNMYTFINESLMSIYFVDPISSRITYCNPSLCRLLGYNQEELLHKTPHHFIDHPAENINSRMKEVIEQKKISNGERRWQRKDGSIVNVLVSSFYHKRNGIDTIYVAALDITERKIAEQKLEDTNKELELFIYKTSHDIRGPLTSIMGLINVSKLEKNESKYMEYLDKIDVVVNKLDYTLGELVKAMKIKDVSSFNEEIDLHEMVDGFLSRFSHFPGFSNLSVSKDIQLKSPFHSNRAILETIFQNLIENAIKYQKTNGHPFLRIHICEYKNCVELIVEDNGIGIDASLQHRVFEMYFRANDRTKGSGLGLYLVKKGIDKLHGTIQVKSELNKGTAFIVSIPSQKPMSMEAKLISSQNTDSVSAA